MRKKIIQLGLLFFFVLLVSIGTNQNGSIHSLAENRVTSEHSFEYKAFNDNFGIQLVGNYVDAYANAFVQSSSMWYDDEENAYGAPDGQYAEIYEDYGNGYLTLDMGLNQEIVNGTGSDFTVVAEGGQYIVRANDDLTYILFPYSRLGFGTGNTSFDLSDINRSSARYVMIEWFYEETTKLDAIEAIHYNQPDYEADPPQITGPEDLLVWSDQNTAQLSWEVSDFTPWNYSILVDDTIVEQGFYWDESLITYTVGLTDITDEVVVTLVLDDTFINRAEDTVRIEIRPGTPTTEPSDTTSNTTIFPHLPLLGGFLAIFLLGKWNKRKDKRT